jgi:phosphoribosyl-dephospho-CoA transferase
MEKRMQIETNTWFPLGFLLDLDILRQGLLSFPVD